MSKTYLANTPLILTDADGTDYRVERGATVVLTDEQFAAVPRTSARWRNPKPKCRLKHRCSPNP